MLGGNLWAGVVLALWLPVSIVLFFTMRPDKAARVAIFGGLLFLPEVVRFRLPMLPELSKQVIPYLGALIGYSLRTPKRVWRLPRETWVRVAMLMFVVGGVGMALTNRDALTYGIYKTITLPGQTVKDGMFVALSGLFRIGIPFFLGTVMVRELKDLEDLLRFLVKAGLIYSLLALFEMRMSPQLHHWLYGYHPNSFAQVYRLGGFRPTIFMSHGLTVAIFFVVTVLSATTLARMHRRRIWGLTPRTAAIYLAVVLVLCRSTGAIVYALVLAPLIWMTSYKTQRRAAVLLGIVVLLYPSLRASDVFPTKTILDWSRSTVGPDRTQSMQFRFDNEDVLLKKARERPWFGWGEYGRNEVYDDMGKVSTITDGEWIIALGINGFSGFLTQFGLLLIPMFLAGRRLRQVADRQTRVLIAGTSVIIAICGIDLLPNSLASNYPCLLAGALLSATAAALRTSEEQAAGEPQPISPPVPRRAMA